MGDITFTFDEMMKWVEEIGIERHRTTANNNRKVTTEFIWPFTNGVITYDTIDAIRNGIFDHYDGPKGADSRKKALGVVKRFLNEFFDVDTARFVKRLEQNKPRSPRRMNKRILEDGDVRNILNRILHEEERPEIKQQHCALVTFLAYTGMRPASAIKLKVSDVRDLQKMDKPYLMVGFDDDKTLTEHYVPLHPVVVKVLGEVIDGKADDEPLFTSYTLLQRFLKEHPTPMINQPSLKVEVRDLRKFMIQKSKVELKLNPDIINYVVSHNLGSLDWKYYQNFKPEVFYDEYMTSWGPVNLLEGILLIEDNSPLSSLKHSLETMVAEAESKQTFEEILSNIDEVIDETSAVIEQIKIFNQGRDEADRITIPSEIPSPHSIRLWINADAANKTTREDLTQDQVDAYKRTIALQLFHKYYDQYYDLTARCLQRGLFIQKVIKHRLN